MKSCDGDIFKNGTPICICDARSVAMEAWVQSVAKQANAKLDWHYSGGRAQVLHLGDEDSELRARQAIEDLFNTLDGWILSRCELGEGLYRGPYYGGD